MPDGNPPTRDALYRAFAGRNAEAYVAYFTARDDGRRRLAWHWPSLLVVFFWALYRKRWGYALALALVGVLALFALVFHAAALANASAEQEAAFSTFWLGVAAAAVVIPPLVTLPLYHRAARAALARTASIAHTGERLAALARLGGTSRVALGIGVIATVALPFALALLGS